MLITLERPFLTESIKRINKAFASSSNLGIAVLFIGASLHFEATKCTLETLDYETVLI